ncbi:MAG: hypothetical protein ACE5EF_12810, partial [Dehalococcoidia bacterium]
MSVRAIARKIGRDRKTIRNTLGLAPKAQAPSKLEPFKDTSLPFVFGTSH